MSLTDVCHWENNGCNEDEGDIPLVLFLTDLILHYDMVQDVQDVLMWAVNEYEGFLVKSCAREITKRGEGIVVEVLMLNKLNFMGIQEAPSKVNFFVWRLVLDRNPTRDQSKKRSILAFDNDCCCVFCFRAEEDSNHLFISYPILLKIWEKVGAWIDGSISLTNLELRIFISFFDKIKVLDKRLIVGVIWMTIVWNI